jgi:universal stress protein E
MFTCKRILAVSDPTLKQQTPLIRALLFAQKTDATIIVLSCIYDKSHDMAAVLNQAERSDIKQAMVEQEKVKIEVEIQQLGVLCPSPRK